MFCNDYTNHAYAWAINPQSPGNNLFDDQGQCGTFNWSAANTFNDPACTVTNNFEHINSTITFEYNHRPSAFDPLEIPTCISGNVSTNPCFSYNLSSCDDLFHRPYCDDDCPEVYDALITSDTIPEYWRSMYRIEYAQYLVSIGETDEALTELEADTTNSIRKVLVQLYTGYGRYDEAIEALAYVNNYGAEDELFIAMYTMLDTMLRDHNFELDPEQIGVLEEIAATDYSLAWSARAILESYFGYSFDRVTEVFESEEERMAHHDKHQLIHPYMKLYPNPATNQIKVSLSYFDTKDHHQVCIYNTIGKLVLVKDIYSIENLVSVNNLSPGIYYCMLNKNGNKVDTQKLVLLNQ